MEHLLLLRCIFIYNWVLFAQKHTALLSTLQRKALTVLCSQQATQEFKVTKVQFQVSSQKGFKVIKTWECEWRRLYKTTNTVIQHIREHFPYRRSLAAEQLLEEIKKGKLFGYVQCDIEVPEILRSKLDDFPPIFKNTLVSKNDIGELMKTYAEEEGILSQPRKMMISSFTLQNGTLITPLLLFYLQLGLVCSKIHRFVEYTPKKCFNSFVHSAVDARR